MKQSMRFLGFGFGTAVVLFVLVGIFMSNEFKVNSSIRLKGTPDQVHVLVADLNNWDQWTPWKSTDPELKVTRSEQTSGVGAEQSWEGAEGSGRLIFTAVKPNNQVVYDVYFSPDQPPCQATITYVAQEEFTLVSWVMTGKVETPVMGGYMAKALPGMIRRMFDQGLSTLRSVVEAENKPIKPMTSNKIGATDTTAKPAITPASPTN